MKIAAYFVLHYGAEYLREAVASIAPLVEKLVAVYTPQPSYGHVTNLACPETEEQLRACFDGNKVEWHSGRFGSEGEHRSTGYGLCNGADLILQCDADEVWETVDLLRCVREAHDGPARENKVAGFVHFWRSFNWACRDVWQPTRILKPTGDGTASLTGKVFHYGYCQTEAITKYKWSIHGHQNELRPGWFEGIFMDETRKRDLHPVVNDWWTAEPFDKTTLPESLRRHPYYDLEVIR